MQNSILKGRQGPLARAARLFSDVVSPPIISAALAAALAWAGSARELNVISAAVYGILVGLIPLGIIAALYRAGRISDMHMSHTGERHLPYLIGFACAVLAWFVIHQLGGSRILEALAICNAIGLGALGLINRYWLISNHSASIMMVTLFSGYVFGRPTGLAIAPLVPLVVAVRLYLRRHTATQLAAGLAVGAAPVLLMAHFGYLG